MDDDNNVNVDDNVNNDNNVGDNNVGDNNIDDNNINDNNLDNNSVGNNYIDDNNADDNNRVDDKWGEDEIDDNDNLDNEVDDEDQEHPGNMQGIIQHATMLSQPSFISIQVHGLLFLNVPSNIFDFGWLTIAHLLNMMPIFQMHNVL